MVFQDPDQDLFVTDANFRAQSEPLLALPGADRRAEEPVRPVERLPGQAQRVRRPAPGRSTPTRRRRPGTRSGTATTTPC
ncbi:hypothetical protein P4129_01685 [Pseudomonas aeruginosa]|nr:hypothetical protein [Pseudomonas aeruginosa]